MLVDIQKMDKYRYKYSQVEERVIQRDDYISISGLN